MKILIRAISNVHVGRIWPASRRFPAPDLKDPNILAQSKSRVMAIEKIQLIVSRLYQVHFDEE